MLDSLRDEPDNSVDSKGQTDKDAKNHRRQNDKHHCVAPQFKHSLNPVTGVRLSIAGVYEVVIDVLPAVLAADD